MTEQLDIAFIEQRAAVFDFDLVITDQPFFLAICTTPFAIVTAFLLDQAKQRPPFRTKIEPVWPLRSRLDPRSRHIQSRFDICQLCHDNKLIEWFSLNAGAREARPVMKH